MAQLQVYEMEAISSGKCSKARLAPANTQVNNSSWSCVMVLVEIEEKDDNE